MTASVVLDEVSNFRCLLKDDGIDGISINDIMIKAVGDALRVSSIVLMALHQVSFLVDVL